MSAVAGDTFVGAGTGAASGAALGSVVPGIGTAIGAGAGALIGGIAGYFKGKSSDSASNTMTQARQQLAELQRQQYAQRMADLNRALAYFQPLQSKFGTNNGQVFGGPQAAAPVGGGAPGSYFSMPQKAGG